MFTPDRRLRLHAGKVAAGLKASCAPACFGISTTMCRALISTALRRGFLLVFTHSAHWKEPCGVQHEGRVGAGEQQGQGQERERGRSTAVRVSELVNPNHPSEGGEDGGIYTQRSHAAQGGRRKRCEVVKAGRATAGSRLPPPAAGPAAPRPSHSHARLSAAAHARSPGRCAAHRPGRGSTHKEAVSDCTAMSASQREHTSRSALTSLA